VIGARGTTGRRVAERLVGRGHRIRAASRSSETRFDWQDEATWGPALAGVDAAYTTYYPDLALPGAAETVGAFADLAVSEGVRRLVLLSGRGEAGAQAAERRIVESGADWALVRCAFFDQNFSEMFAEPIRNGVLTLPGGATREPFLDAEDIAEVVVAALTDPRHVGELYELTDPRLLTLADAAAELGQAMGRPVRYVPVTASEYVTELVAYGFPEEEAGPVAHLIADVLDGRNSHLTDGVQRALGRAPRDFREFARDAAATGAFARTGAAA